MKPTLINNTPAILDNNGSVIISNLTCGIRGKSNGKSFIESAEGEWRVTENRDCIVFHCDNAKINIKRIESGLVFYTEYTVTESISLTEDFIALSGDINNGISSIYGSYIKDFDGTKANDMLSGADTTMLSEDQSFECGDFGIIENSENKKILLGALTGAEFFSGVFACADGNFEARQYTEFADFKAGTVLKSDVFCITYCEDPISALENYSDLICSHSPIPPTKQFEVPSGYCTWYYFLGDINESIIENATTEMARHSVSLPVKYIQIDDGWQKCYGEWEAGEKFPNGMKAHADHITSKGFLPGLWFAPLWANKARIKQEHPEYFTKDRTTGEVTKTLDLSVPEARDFLREVFRKATYDWGYKYLKLDLFTTCFGSQEFRDPTYNSLKNYRKCLEVIRESIPKDTFILGCTAPFLASVGLVDGIRVCPDIAGEWIATKEVFNRVFNRYFYHKKLFINDSDCLIIRKAENEDEECNRNCVRTDEENKLFVSAMAASGGTLMFSDKLSLLGEEQLKWLSYLFPANTDTAIPLDITKEYIPSVLDCGKRGDIRTVMLINWEEKEKSFSLDVENSHVFEFWSQEYRGICSSRYEKALPPHSCEVLFISEASKPTVVGSDSVIIPSVKSAFANDTLSVSFSKPGESYYVAANKASSESCSIEKVSDGLFKLTHTDNLTFEVTFK